MTLQSAREYHAAAAEVVGRGVKAARRARRGPAAELARVVVAYQALAVRASGEYVPEILAEQGIDAATVATPSPVGLLGVASDGRSLSGLLGYAVGAAVTNAEFDRIVATQLQDVGRAAGEIQMGVRPAVTGYVRVVSGSACSRCMILAGRIYRWNEGFERHPGCNCEHVPTTDARAEGVMTNPQSMFESLSAAEQDRRFGRAGAQAIRDGADMGQVVNARRGMDTMQSGLLFTREGATTRGRAYKLMAERGRGGVGHKTRTGKGTNSVRLMPESIYKVATSREDALWLLRTYGYIH